MLQNFNNKFTCLSRPFSQHFASVRVPSSASSSAFVEAVLARGCIWAEVVLVLVVIAWKSLPTANLLASVRSVVESVLVLELMRASHVQRMIPSVLTLTTVLKPLRFEFRPSSVITTTSTVSVHGFPTIIESDLDLLLLWLSRSSFRLLRLLRSCRFRLFSFCFRCRLAILGRTRFRNFLSGLGSALIGVLTSISSLSARLRLRLINRLLSGRFLLRSLLLLTFIVFNRLAVFFRLGLGRSSRRSGRLFGCVRLASSPPRGVLFDRFFVLTLDLLRVFRFQMLGFWLRRILLGFSFGFSLFL